jgi:DNA-binding MarR family transcriptional regulator
VDSTVAVTTTSLMEVITVAQRDLARRIATVLAPEGFTVDQWRILRTLADGAGHSMGELADSLRIPNPTLTRAVDGLVDQSLVYRRQDADDRRRFGVHLARRGHARLTRLNALVDAQEAAVCTTSEWRRLAVAVGKMSDT